MLYGLQAGTVCYSLAEIDELYFGNGVARDDACGADKYRQIQRFVRMFV